MTLNQPELNCPNFAEPNSGVCCCMVLKQWPIRACHALRSGVLIPLCGSTNWAPAPVNSPRSWLASIAGRLGNCGLPRSEGGPPPVKNGGAAKPSLVMQSSSSLVCTVCAKLAKLRPDHRVGTVARSHEGDHSRCDRRPRAGPTVRSAARATARRQHDGARERQSHAVPERTTPAGGIDNPPI